VKNYSSRHLSYPWDKLPALSALAQEFGRRLQSTIPGLVPEYIAGLWKHDLPKALMWHTGRTGSKLLPRPTSYRAPSWSWASVDGEICLFQRSSRDFNLTIFDCVVTPVSPLAPYAKISEARLTVYGRVSRGTWDLTKNSIAAEGRTNKREKPWLLASPDTTVSAL